MKNLFILLFFASFLFGQLSMADVIGVRGLALQRKVPMPERYVKVKDGHEFIHFLSSQPVELIKAIVESELYLYEKKMNDEGQEVYEIAERIKLPFGARGILLLGWKDEGKYRYLAIKDHFSDAKYNDWLMINTTSKTLGIQVGKKKKPFFLKPKQETECKIDSPAEVGAAVIGRANLEGEVKEFYSTYWPIRKGERSIVVFVDQKNKIIVKKISDILFKPKADEDSAP
jgi:hypothetical protein